MASTLVSADEIPGSELSAVDRADLLTYESVTNFARAVKGDPQMCVMCGNGPESNAVIPRQNKDVCRDCDKAIWLHSSTSAFFKWCKGCKNFLQIGNFSQKLDAAKCDKCRERGRTSYLLKKRHAASTPPTAKQPKHHHCYPAAHSHSPPRGEEYPSGGGRRPLDDDYSDEAQAHAQGCSSSSAVGGVFPRPSHHPRADDDSDVVESDDDDLAAPRTNKASALASSSSMSSSSSKKKKRTLPRGPHFLNSEESSSSEPQSDSAAAISLVALAKTPEDAVVVGKVSSTFGCSLAKISSSSESDENDADDPKEDPLGSGAPFSSSSTTCASCEKNSQGLLFELAAIHSTILKLEQRADLVPKLEAQIDTLKADLAAARAKETHAAKEVQRLKALDGSDDERSAANHSAKRPRLISFDADQTTAHNNNDDNHAQGNAQPATAPAI